MQRLATGRWSLPANRLEAIKWFAFACMLIDHVDAYVFGRSMPWTYIVGRLAFPLFAAALAAGLALGPIEHGKRTLMRLVVAAVLVQPLAALVRDELTLNVLWTLALGVALWLTLAHAFGVVGRALTWLAVLVGGFECEFGHVGIVLVTALLWWARCPTWWRSTVAFVAVGLLWVVNGGPWALLAIPVAIAIVLWGEELPRVRYAFYWAYGVQFPLLQAARVVWGEP